MEEKAINAAVVKRIVMIVSLDKRVDLKKHLGPSFDCQFYIRLKPRRSSQLLFRHKKRVQPKYSLFVSLTGYVSEKEKLQRALMMHTLAGAYKNADHFQVMVFTSSGNSALMNTKLSLFKSLDSTYLLVYSPTYLIIGISLFYGGSAFLVTGEGTSSVQRNGVLGVWIPARG